MWKNSHTEEGSNLQRLQIISRGLTFSLPHLAFLLFQTLLSSSLLPSLSLHFPAMCCDYISHCASPHSEGFHFRAEPGSHRRYWNLLPKQHRGWTLLLCRVLLMRVCLSQLVYVCKSGRWCTATFIFNVSCGPHRIKSDGDDAFVRHVRTGVKLQIFCTQTHALTGNTPSSRVAVFS